MLEFVTSGEYWDEFYLAVAILTLVRCLWMGGWIPRWVGTLVLIEWFVKNAHHNFSIFTPMLNSVTGLAILCLTLYVHFASGYQSKTLYWMVVAQVLAIFVCGVHSAFSVDWSLALSLNIVFFLKLVAVNTQLGREAVPFGFRQTS